MSDQPDATAVDEGWVYDQSANKLTLFAEMSKDGDSMCTGADAS